MRVLIVNTYYYPEMVGGAEHSVKKLAEHLCAAGVECAVLCTGAHDENTQVEGVRIFRRRMKKRDRVIDLVDVPKPIRLIHEIQNTYCSRNASVLGAVLDEFKPDLIHSNGVYDISPVIWKCAKDRNIPIVHTLRDYSLLCPRVQLMKRGQTTQCTDPYIWCRAYREVNRSCSRWVDFVTAPSNRTLSLLRDHGFFKSAQSRAIPNAHELDDSTPVQLEKRKQSEKSGFQVVYLGELHEKKGLKWLLEAFHSLEDQGMRLVIAGRGPLEEEVRSYAQRDPRIEYAGFLNEKQVGQLLDDSDVLACPSLWEEPFGRVVIDAYKHAMPVIATNMGAFPEIVRDGATGIVVPADQPEKLADALMVYRRDRGMWLKGCENAANEMRRFSMEEHVRSYIEVYRTVSGKE